MNVVGTEGRLDTIDIILVRKQTWDMTTKIKPIAAPIK